MGQGDGGGVQLIKPFFSIGNQEVAAIGDSITGYYVGALANEIINHYGLVDLKVSGEQTATMLARFENDVINRSIKPAYVIIMEGANDINTSDLEVAAIESNLQSCYTLAKNAGITVVALTITPLGGAAGMTPGKQAKIDAVNAWILNTATDVDYRVDTYTALEDPETPDQMLAAYDSGDHVHPSAAGGQVIANTIAVAVGW